jgi:hypothetical protein
MLLSESWPRANLNVANSVAMHAKERPQSDTRRADSRVLRVPLSCRKTGPMSSSLL